MLIEPFPKDTDTLSQRAAKNPEVARRCDDLGLTACINGNTVQWAYNRGPKEKAKSATMEAIIGAVYLDGGFDTAVAVMKTLGFLEVQSTTSGLGYFAC